MLPLQLHPTMEVPTDVSSSAETDEAPADASSAQAYTTRARAWQDEKRRKVTEHSVPRCSASQLGNFREM